MPYCKECGKKLLADDMFCPRCGTKVAVKRASVSAKVVPKKPQFSGLGAWTWALIGVCVLFSFVLIALGIWWEPAVWDPTVPDAKHFLVALGIGIAIVTVFGALVENALIKRRQI